MYDEWRMEKLVNYEVKDSIKLRDYKVVNQKSEIAKFETN